MNITRTNIDKYFKKATGELTFERKIVWEGEECTETTSDTFWLESHQADSFIKYLDAKNTIVGKLTYFGFAITDYVFFAKERGLKTMEDFDKEIKRIKSLPPINFHSRMSDLQKIFF